MSNIRDSIRQSPSLRASVWDGIFFSAMIGFGEAYLGAFGIYLQANALQVGILGSLPQLLGAISQLFAMRLLGPGVSRRDRVAQLVFWQALVWLPIAGLCLILEPSASAAWTLIALAVLYQLLGGISTPLWSSLVGDLIDEKQRGSFFGYRNAQMGLATFGSLVLGGGLLALAERFHEPALGFLLIFLLAGLCRLASFWELKRHDDPPVDVHERHYFSFWMFLRRLPKANFARFTVFIAFMNFAACVGGPFVSLYLLRDVGLNYAEFTAFCGVIFLSQFFSFAMWGRFSDRFGSRLMLRVATFGIAFFPLCLCISSDLWWILLTHALHGIFWAGFQVGAQLFLYDAVTPQKRARCAAYQNVLNGVGMYLGALLGAALENMNWFSAGPWTVSSPLLQVFLASSLLRLFGALILVEIFREVRDVPKLTHKDLLFWVTQIRPMAGLRISVEWPKRAARTTRDGEK